MEDKAEDFEKIYREFCPKIVGYLKRLVGDHDAEDVAQEVFLKVTAALETFRGESSLSTWIYRIATNAAMDHLRKSSPAVIEHVETSSTEDEPLLCEGYMAVEVSAPLLDTQLIRKEMNECIRGIVDGLPENYRTVLILSDLEGLTNKDISEVLDISIETIKIRLHRGRACLRKELEGKCNFYRDDRNELACDRKTVSLNFLKK
jgi:RNA polymerase sigma-70 factor (ECF subfamily)